MKKNFFVIAALVIAVSALLISVGALTGWVNAGTHQQTERLGNPLFISYQGQIRQGETPFDGTGYFLFAIVDGSGTSTIWTNDGDEPPDSPVPLEVHNGLFSVLLGDPSVEGMGEPLLPSVFYETDRKIRVWFSPSLESEFTQMPDQVIAAVPYAYSAGFAENAEFLGPYGATDFQLLVTGTCKEGQVIKEILWDGSVVCEGITGYGTFTYSLVDPTNDSSLPSIAIGTDGLGLISYTDHVDEELLVAHCENVNCTSVVTTVLDTLDEIGGWSSVAIGSDGFGLISYRDETNTNLKIAHCLNTACTSANTYTVDTLFSVGYFSSVAIGADGYGLLAYTRDDDLRISHCNNISCSAVSATMFDTGIEGIPDITIGADGYGLISYIKGNDLWVAHCTTANCSTAEFNIIQYDIYDEYEPPNGVYLYTSIAASDDGLILVSYYDWQARAMKVARCFDEACSSPSPSIATVYNVSGSDGAASSITIGIDGMGILGMSIDDDWSVHITQCKTLPCIGVQDNMVGTIYYGAPQIAIGQDGLGLVTWTNSDGLYTAHCGNIWCNPPINVEWEETP